MNLRALGTWIEDDWEYPLGRVRPDAEALKRFRWECAATSAKTGTELKLMYYTTNRVPVHRMEDLGWVAAREKDALDLLERPIRLSLEGVGYLPPVNPLVIAHHKVAALIGGWITEGGYPEAWQPELQHAFGAAHHEGQRLLAVARDLGAVVEPDPVLATFGWRVPIRPLSVPLVQLA